MIIKVCGMKDPDNIKAVAELEPDYMGFICYDLSARYIDDLQPAVPAGLPSSICKTGVFVNEPYDGIRNAINLYGFNAVQLHGNETPELCKSLLHAAIVIKAFGIDDQFDFEQLNKYAGCVNYFMFDTKTAGYGGSGKTFDWDILKRYNLDVPFFLSGGLSYDNLQNIKHLKHPAFYGVDLNSRFETAPGLKDIRLLQQAFNLIRNTP